MNTLTLIWNFIKKYYQIIIFALVIVLSALLFNTYNTLKTERAQREFEQKKYTQNVNALKDSLTVEFDKKLKAYVFEKENFIVNELNELKQYNKKLYDKLNNIKGDVIAAIDSKVTGDLGGIKANNEIVVIDSSTNNYGLKFKSDYKDEGFEQHLEGVSKFYAYPDEFSKKWMLAPDTTLFTKNLTQINITYGFRDLNDKYEVFAISKSKKIKISELEGVLVLDKCPDKMPQKSKRWGIGPYFGAGLNTDLNGSNPRFGMSAGMSIHYSIFKW